MNICSFIFVLKFVLKYIFIEVSKNLFFCDFIVNEFDF